MGYVVPIISLALLSLLIFEFIEIAIEESQYEVIQEEKTFPEPVARKYFSGGPPKIMFVRVPKTGSSSLRNMCEAVGDANKVLWSRRLVDIDRMTRKHQVS